MNHSVSSRPRLLRVAVWAIALTGCQSYGARPLDVSQYLTTWRAQGPPLRAAPAAPAAPRDPGAPGRLTAMGAVQLALVSNPAARALRLEAGAAELGADVSGDWNNPTLTAELRRAVDGGASPWFVAGGLAFTVPLSSRHALRRERALATASVSRLQAIAYEEELAAAVQIAWLDWSLAVRRQALLRDYAAALSGIADVAEGLAKTGELPLSERGVLPIEQAKTEIEVESSRTEAEQRRLALLALIGLAPEVSVELVGGFEVAPPPLRPPPGWPGDHVRVRLALSGVTAAERSWELAVARRGPDLTVGPTFEWADDRAFVGVGVSLPLPSLDLNRREIVESRGRREAMQARAEMAIQALDADRRRARVGAAAAETRLARLEALEVRVQEQLAEVEALSRHGELDALLVRHVLQQALETRVAIARAQRDLAAAHVSLRALYGAPATTERGVE